MGTKWARCPKRKRPNLSKGASLLVVKEGLEPSTRIMNAIKAYVFVSYLMYFNRY